MSRSRILACILLTLAVSTSAVAPAWAATLDELNTHRDRADDARKRAAAADRAASRLAQDVVALDARIDAIEKEAAALEPQIAEATSRTQRIQVEVDKLNARVIATKAEIEATQADYDREQQLLAQRMSESYRQGEWFYMEILFGSRDISDLIQRTEFVNRLIASNNEAAGRLERTQLALERAKVKLDRSLKDVQLKRREAKAVENQLRGMQDAKERNAAQQESIRQDKASLMADNRANAKRLRALAEQEEAESAKIAAELAGRGGSGEFAGSMVWPVPASHRITSPYGWRICPFHGREMHPGIDIGAASGSDIVAAASGEVIFAGYRGGYGNTIMIDHGNGVVTLYAHQSRLVAGSGQQVTAGQLIGKVGSTGNSTGPHLHFELRANGQPKNPMTYQ